MRYCESSSQWLMGHVYNVKVCHMGHLSPEINKVPILSALFFSKSGARRGITQNKFHNSRGTFLMFFSLRLQQLTSAKGERTWTHTHAQMRALPSMTQIKDEECMATTLRCSPWKWSIQSWFAKGAHYWWKGSAHYTALRSGGMCRAKGNEACLSTLVCEHTLLEESAIRVSWWLWRLSADKR